MKDTLELWFWHAVLCCVSKFSIHMGKMLATQLVESTGRFGTKIAVGFTRIGKVVAADSTVVRLAPLGTGQLISSAGQWTTADSPFQPL
jgi:hypothetical protein